jgi:RNA polymerase sigma-70 factor (ECF subfamily)
VAFLTRFDSMEQSSLGTTQLTHLVVLIRAGDTTARDELLRRTLERLQRLAAAMLARRPQLRAQVEPDDVLQNAAVRLLRSLESVQPRSVREFYALAATHIRRELIDLGRYFSRQCRPPPVSAGLLAEDSSGAQGNWDPAADSTDTAELERWCHFHQAVEHLPAEEREAFGLSYYQGWTQAEISELLAISPRTVRRRIQSAMVALHSTLKEDEGP